MRISIAFLAAALALWPRPARADGAFPDELQVFAPADHPSRLVVAANFGLLESEDSGKSWYYVCERQAGASGNISLYQFGPTGTLLGDALIGAPLPPGQSALTRSADLGCTWGNASGCFPVGYVWDAAFDPTNPGKVLALSNASDAGGDSSAVFPSTDDGVTFGCPVYTTPSSLQGIEFCQSQSGTLYLTGNHLGDAGTAPFVVEGFDGGAAWSSEIDHPELAATLATYGTDAGLSPDAGAPLNPILKLAAVDPNDCRTVYFLLLRQDGRRFIAVTHDSGQTIQVIFGATPGMPISAFLIGQDGTAYVGQGCAPGSSSPCPNPGLWTAPPGSTTFQQASQINVQCLAERAGVLYAGGNNWVDHFALGSSTDKGQSWTPLLLFQSIAGLAACPDTDIVKTCGSTWCGETGLVGFFGIQDAGYPCDAGGAGGSGGTGGGSTSSPTGCGCGVAGDAAGLLGFLGLVMVWRRKRG